jgi:beta-lactamase class A
MRTFFFCLLSAFLFFFQPGCVQPQTPSNLLKNKIETHLAIDSAVFGIAYKNLSTGETFFHNERNYFHAASTMKTPVLIEIFKQAKEGRFSISDRIALKNSFTSIADGSSYTLDSTDDSEFDLYQKLGQSYPIESLAYDMITRSSNLATNMLIEKVGAENIMKTLHELGAKDMQVLRGVEDNKAFAKGLNNKTTALDLLILFEQMAMYQIVDTASSKAMINILLDQQFKEIIPAQLPPSVKVAHKTGSINGIQHDSGIVFLPGGERYVVVLLSSFKPGDEKKVVQAMANVSRVLYEHTANAKE